ncbi:3-isopropylmalate dehydratase, large subunit [Coraliomargarita akajimensis DSM 45221]|uniref:3-isopropylmalate dehydratase large subunit n=2 Tax=Coraliomargarita TaxID=442430 RepID=D5EQK9_CORAD|nr:3-isopropylmalate dehydratase, large subunit [Coraliomargarita akajimensis DSM 45221]
MCSHKPDIFQRFALARRSNSQLIETLLRLNQLSTKGHTMGKSLFQKVWDAHAVRTLANGQTQLLIGTHLIHEVTSPQAFGMLRDKGLSVKYPQRTFATVDHIVPTNEAVEPYSDPLAQGMISELRKNCAENDITFFDTNTGKQGVVHIVGPEQGITQPGTTIACGDSHTATHGAFGAIAFGIGTSQVRDVLATQTIALGALKVRRINVDGDLRPGVYAKDVILHIIRLLGTQGGTGFAYEYAGSTFDNMTMEERMTVCNMSIEGGARVGYVNPDETTFEYLKGRPYSPQGEAWDAAVENWKSFASDADCSYDDVVNINAADIEPTVTWGITPGQGVGINENIPAVADGATESERESINEALEYMKFEGGSAIKGKKIDVAFLGSCTNGRLSDFQEVAKYIEGKKVADGVQAIVVPGSQVVASIAEQLGLDKVFKEAGFEWRGAGCSMCLAMNPDKLVGDQLCASSSNRNFKGRQGSPTGRTLLMSPLMVAAAAVTGEVSDAREVFGVTEPAMA